MGLVVAEQLAAALARAVPSAPANDGGEIAA